MITQEQFDDNGSGRFRILLTIALIVLSVGFGYSLGIRYSLKSPRNAMLSAPLDPEMVGMMESQAQKARARGDAQAEGFFKDLAGAYRERLVAWGNARAHGEVDENGQPVLKSGAGGR
ncbi:MAG TPA: hypothetical protein VH475_14745 [Tepidisphaeraceae bacterium]|jgi:hypothetical protein